VLDRLRGLAVEQEHRAEPLDVPLAGLVRGQAPAALERELHGDLLGEQVLRLVDAPLGGPRPPVDLPGEPFLALLVGAHVPGRRVQREGGEYRQPQVARQRFREFPEPGRERAAHRRRAAARRRGRGAGDRRGPGRQLEQQRPDSPGDVPAQAAPLAQRLDLRGDRALADRGRDGLRGTGWLPGGSGSARLRPGGGGGLSRGCHSYVAFHGSLSRLWASLRPAG
jgi:hypothetical protein